MAKWKQLIGFVMIFLIVFMTAKPAFAMEKNIFNEKRSTLPVNEKVDNVIILGHNIDIKGKVDTAAIVVNGNMNISKTARINGIVLVINGTVTQEPGSYVRENILAFKFTNQSVNYLLTGLALLLSSWAVQLIVSSGLVLLTVLVGFLLKNKGAHKLELYKEQAGKIVLVGVVASIALSGIIGLLVITVFGIPLAILLAIVPFVFFMIGVTLLSRIIGEKLLVNRQLPVWLKDFAGAFVTIAIFNFPFFGLVIALAVLWFSTGFMILWLKEKPWRKQK
ncbi:hypothetical protein ACQYAD_12920 [Neobacillus sp. SM06]|uniref:hypothetical protein n=1 Tax=Neobacillus sp. SM06 TaxID=3422492 RepID=UPI003D282AEE